MALQSFDVCFSSYLYFNSEYYIEKAMIANTNRLIQIWACI